MSAFRPGFGVARRPVARASVASTARSAGDNARFLEQVQELVESHVKFMVLLKLSDAGQPSYDRDLAQQLTKLGAHCFGSTPKLLIEIMERILKHQPYDHLARNTAP